jgi:pseudolysin
MNRYVKSVTIGETPMKLGKLKRLLQGCVLGAFIVPWTVVYAAEQEILWGNVGKYTSLLKQFSLIQNASIPKDLRLPPNFSTQKNPINTFQLINGTVDYANRSHVRYDQYYRDLPVWGSQVIYHRSSNSTTITGSIIHGIDQDVLDLNGKISVEQAKKIAIGRNLISSKVTVEKIIYFDHDVSPKATLAYHVSYLKRTSNGPELASFIIDANTGKVLEEWNALPSAEVGQGPGGVTIKRLPYRPANFQYGAFQLDTKSLGKLDVEYSAGVCTISNNLFRVINLKNRTERQLPFELPASSADERTYKIKPFSYSCTAPSYVNINDGGFSPINDGLSPVNDAAYFVKQTFNMLTNQYKIVSPVGTLLPVRVYTQIANFDNAFACGPTCMRESGLSGPQQLVFGNGTKKFSPITDGDGVSHEFGHLVTEHFSNLVYHNQSGGLNESFSDMTGMAMLDYQRTTLGYSWYWDGLDWTTGASVSKTGNPLRFLDNPPLDGQSIDNAANYVRGMDTHFSSGVFNKAFYLLSTKLGWTVTKAYQVMLDANMHYWTKGTTFQLAGCGVLQAARDRAYPEQDVKDIFQQVGVNLASCK